MSRSAQDVLEFDKLRELLRQRTTCVPGRRNIDALMPINDRAALDSANSRSSAKLANGSVPAANSVSAASPIRSTWLDRIEGAGAALEPREFLDAATLLDTAAWLKPQFKEDAAKFPLLAARAASLADFRDLLTAIRRAILPNGEISDDASPALRRIRASVSETRTVNPKNAQANSPLAQCRRRRRLRHAAQRPLRHPRSRRTAPRRPRCNARSQRHRPNRFPRAARNRRLQQSARPARRRRSRRNRPHPAKLTERLQAMRDAARRRRRNHRRTRQRIRPRAFRAGFRCHHAGIFRRRTSSASTPRAIPSSKTSSAAKIAPIIPMSLSLGGDERLLVISGPNTGGKTVALKTTGIAALSAQSGIPVAAQRAVLPIFDRVLVDIGDEQSIAADLSTFSAHMLNLKSMLDEATPQTLVLVDEMGTGTAPEEGAALAVALLDEFRAKNCIVLATTHHDRLKTYASTTPGVVNAAVEFDDVNLRPTYRLMVGVPGGPAASPSRSASAFPHD